MKQLDYWIPRVLAAGFILFLSLFSLDVFSLHVSLQDTLIALAMHLIPSMLFLILLGIAWKQEVLGGSLFLFAAAVSLLAINLQTGLPLFMIILFIGLLFVVDGKHTHPGRHQHEV